MGWHLWNYVLGGPGCALIGSRFDQYPLEGITGRFVVDVVDAVYDKFSG